MFIFGGKNGDVDVHHYPSLGIESGQSIYNSLTSMFWAILGVRFPDKNNFFGVTPPRFGRYKLPSCTYIYIYIYMLP